MADRGPLPSTLQIKRINVEIRRLEHQIEFQEMECMELETQILSKQENIAASQIEISKQRVMLINLVGPGSEQS
jgi:hypothetical protein